MNSNGLHLLVIGPGFGGGREGAKYKYLAEAGHDIDLIDLPEPTAYDHDALATGIAMLQESITVRPPDILVASSRGGKYAAALLSSGFWRGPTFLISAMATTDCCAVEAPMLLCHGTRDKTNVIERVRNDVASSAWAKLVEFEDDHSLHKLVDGGRFDALLHECYEMQFNKPHKGDSPKTNTKRYVAPARGDFLTQIRGGVKLRDVTVSDINYK